MNILVKKADFAKFFASLADRYEIIAPVKSPKGFNVFSEIKSFDEVDFSQQTRYSLRKYFLPDGEVLLRYKKGKPIQPEIESKKRIFIIHPCDANALLRVDKLYLDEYKDPFYAQRRKDSLLFVFKCQQPYENCFCTSMGTDTTSNYDLLFTDMGNKYIITPGTERGRELTAGKMFVPIIHEGMTCLECERKVTDLDKLDRLKEDKAWKKEADDCLSCNGCVTVCPTCMCFDVNDRNNLDLESGERVRHWDYCEVKDFTRVAGDYSFRDKRYSRYRHRIMHKFKYFKDKYAVHLCVGCGRCIDVCPAGLDMIKTVERLGKE